MDSILKSLVDPAWWFTGVFFTLVALALPHIFRAFRRSLRSFVRRRVARGKWRIKNMRLNSGLVQYAIGRANAHYTIFLLLAFAFVFGLPIITNLNGGKVPIPLEILLSVPAFAFEIAWMVSDSFVNELIVARQRFCRSKPLRLSHDL